MACINFGSQTEDGSVEKLVGDAETQTDDEKLDLFVQWERMTQSLLSKHSNFFMKLSDSTFRLKCVYKGF